MIYVCCFLTVYGRYDSTDNISIHIYSIHTQQTCRWGGTTLQAAIWPRSASSNILRPQNQVAIGAIPSYPARHVTGKIICEHI